MRFILATIIMLMAAPALGATLSCEIPVTSVARGLELCEEIRVRLRMRGGAEWDNDICASYIFRLGMIEAEKRSTRSSFNQSVNSAVSDAVTDLTTNWPPPTPATCGDGIVDDTDPDLGEQCDPPDGGVTCDDSCQTVP